MWLVEGHSSRSTGRANGGAEDPYDQIRPYFRTPGASIPSTWASVAPSPSPRTSRPSSPTGRSSSRARAPTLVLRQRVAALGEFTRVCEAEALFLARLVLSAADGCAVSGAAPRMEE